MRFFRIEPEVAGGLGEGTVMDRSVHPPRVFQLHYDFDGYPDDAIQTSFPVYIVTEAAMRAIEHEHLTGAAFDTLQVTTSDDFDERHPGARLPPFVWLKVHGMPGEHDFGLEPDTRLVVSEKALAMLRRLGLSYADVEPVALGP